MPPSDPSSTAQRKEQRPQPHRRTYQACTACRSAKLRCDLGDPDKPNDPPCKRCLRTGRNCVFGGVYLRKKEDDGGTGHDRSESVDPMGGDEHWMKRGPSHPPMNQRYRHLDNAFDTDVHRPLPSYQEPNNPQNLSFSSSNPSAYSSNLPSTFVKQGNVPKSDHEFKFVRGETLENPADALRILAAAVEDERPNLRILTEDDHSVEPQRWNRWIPVRDGLLTADEASILLSLYVMHHR